MARFLLLGSGEFEPWTHEVEALALAEAKGDGSVVILPTASTPDGDVTFDRWGQMGLDHYAEAGVSAEVLPARRREDADRDDLVARVEAASMIYCSGGKPQHLANVLRDSPMFAAIQRGLQRGAVYAGCSAGAMVASRARDGARGSSWLFGLGLVPHAAFGAHWDKARKIPGAAWWMTSRVPDDTWFVGIDERTAIWGDGETWSVHGQGSVDLRRGDARTTHGPGETFETQPAQASR